MTREAKYADLIEQTLYNGFLAGVGLDGQQFFYENPLASAGDHHRKGWFTCACCPPNVARLLASLGQYLYSTSGGELYVNQYVGSTLSTTVDGTPVELEQSSGLPWSGEVTLDIDAEDSVPINIRLPEWSSDVTISIDGEAITNDETGYVCLEREWDDTRVEITIEQRTDLIAANPAVDADTGRVAVKRGPLVYCTEAVDTDRPLHQYALATDAEVEATHEPTLLDGVSVLEATAVVPTLDEWEEKLYRPVEETERSQARLQLVPYYAWDNRDPGAMQVWHRLDGV